MIKTVPLLLFCFIIPVAAFCQSDQEKAQMLVKTYLENHSNLHLRNNLKFSAITSLKSSYTDTKTYQNYQHKIDSLELEGRKIDARIVKMKTEAEINQAKKDSKHLSDQLATTSDAMIEFMTTFKSKPIGWQIKSAAYGQRKNRTYNLNKELTKVTSVK